MTADALIPAEAAGTRVRHRCLSLAVICAFIHTNRPNPAGRGPDTVETRLFICCARWTAHANVPNVLPHLVQGAFMGQPGYPPGYGQPPQQVDNNMTMSIVSIFLFWPLAIPAIINASKVAPLVQQGDIVGAQAAAAESKRWSKLALIIGIIGWAIGLIGCCLIIVLGSAVSNTTG